MNTQNNNNKRKALILGAMGLLPLITLAAEGQAAQTVSYFSNPLFNTLLAVIILLAIMVSTLSRALKNIVSSDLFLEKMKRDKERNTSKAGKVAGLLILFSLMSLSAMAQEQTEAAQVVSRIGGLDYFTFYLMCTIIFLELVTLFVLFNTFKNILGYETLKAEQQASLKPKAPTLFEKMNYQVAIEDEEAIMLDHDYDGIRELDNNLPPWWKYGFYLTILISVVYLVNYHVTKTAPLQAEEYQISMKKAEAEIAEFMKTSANNVDENSVKMLTEASDINAGKDLFISNCAACHLADGGGSVGPNLTDEYWLHGGSVKDVFKTIKYGWPDKGMKSWKDDFSPMQIAQLTSFIRSLKGTTPAKAKEKQGEFFSDSGAAPAGGGSDSTKVLSADTLKTVAEQTKN